MTDLTRLVSVTVELALTPAPADVPDRGYLVRELRCPGCARALTFWVRADLLAVPPGGTEAELCGHLAHAAGQLLHYAPSGNC